MPVDGGILRISSPSLIRQRSAIEDHAVELLAESSDYQLLRTIPGIGPIDALTILAETEPMQVHSPDCHCP